MSNLLRMCFTEDDLRIVLGLTETAGDGNYDSG